MVDKCPFNENIEIDFLDTYAHFAAKRFRWSLKSIRESWDNEFFSCIRIEEELIEKEEKEYKKQSKGHTGGKGMKGSRGHVKHIDEPDKIPDDPKMEALFDKLIDGG